jgi:hypothetical protein
MCNQRRHAAVVPKPMVALRCRNAGLISPGVNVCSRGRRLEYFRFATISPHPLGVPDRALDVPVHSVFVKKEDDFAVRTLS